MIERAVVSVSIALLLGSPGLLAQVTDFHPVTEETLRNPAPGDWLNWRRTDNAWGYSPLDEIDGDNVGQLQLVWSWAMDESGPQEATPLVYDGIMYLPNPSDVIQALDAATGDLIWEYRPEVEPGAEGGGTGAQKSIAIYGDKIFGATRGAHIVALDARTGRVVWDTETADSGLGYKYSAGPIVVRGTVIAGITGCDRYKEDICFVAGLDADTGEEKWRTSSVALPGEPGGDTWGDLPLEFRAGSDMWITGSYDPEANLVYWGTSQAKPWARSVRGTDGDALYTNSTLALDPDTGELVWYYQHLPGETNDMDDGFENILLDVGGQPSLFKMGKLAILWQLNRETGAFIHATDLGYQNIVDVDPETGEVTYLADMIPEIGVEMTMCPSTSGFKSWRAMAFNPETNATLHPHDAQLRAGHIRPDRTSHRWGRDRSGAARRLQTSRRPGPSGSTPSAGHRDRRAVVAPSHGVPDQYGRTHDGRRPRVRRRLRSLCVRLRRSHRGDPVADASSDLGAGISRDVLGEWKAVRGRAGWSRRWELGHAYSK